MRNLTILLGIAGIAAVLVYSYILYVTDRECNHLRNIARDETLISQLWDQIMTNFDDPSLLRNAGRFKNIEGKSVFSARIHAQDVPGNLGIDWDALDIPLEHATFQVLGEGMSEGNFSIDLVNQIRIGFGYRYFLRFDVKGRANSNGSSEKDVSSLPYALSVGCLN